MAQRPEQVLQRLKAALATTQQVALERGIWPAGARVKAEGAALYRLGFVWNEAGKPIRILAPSREHYLWKAKNGMIVTRGNMTGTLARAYAAPQSLILHSRGFTISVPRANFVATVPGRTGGPGTGKRSRKEQSSFLNVYFRYQNLNKAFSRIGRLGELQRKKVAASGMAAIDGHLKANLRDAMRVKGGIREVRLRLGSLGLEGF